MTKTNQFKALAGAAAMALALSLLAWVAAEPAHAAFPGLNGDIAFERGTKIWMKNPTLSAAETKLRAEIDPDSQPAFSPDGSRVAFMRRSEIYVTRADGTGTPTRLTTDCLLDSDPAWSHDGTRIVFVRRSSSADPTSCGGQYNIWTMNADGSGTPTQLTTDGLKSVPAWSVPTPGAPDGKIVYRHSASQLWTMDPDGNNKTRLNYSCPNDNGGICDTSVGIPTFSPDGTKVAFDYSGDIYWTYTSGVDPSTGLTPIAYPILRDRRGTETTADDTEYPGDEGEAAWSPDGTKIAFQHNGNVAGSQSAIYVANADGSSMQATQVTSVGALNPDWQPVTLRIGDARVRENNTSARFTVSLSGASQQTVTVAYATADGSAKAPADYTTKTGTLTFAPNETSKTVSVAVRGDRKNEPNETFFVNLSGSNTIISDASGKGTIVDND